eukprot:gene7724-12194_t
MEKFKIPNISTVFYIPEFISEEKEEEILKNVKYLILVTVMKIYSQNSSKWTNLLNRRLQNHGGIPNAQGMLSSPLPDWLNELGKKMNDECSIFQKKLPNHVLINEYLPGQGIMSHKDGPIYDNIVGSISLESYVMITFSKDKFSEKQEHYSFILEPRSLIIFTDDIYDEYLHGIDENEEFELKEEDNIVNLHLLKKKLKIGDKIKREKRISLTHRVVKKTIKKSFLKFK